MKSKILVLFMTATMMFSCSNDDNNESDSNNIVGTWVATELNLDDATASDNEKNLRDGLNILTARECYVVTLTFNDDLTVDVENSINYIEIVELDIPCPTEKDSDSGTYSYDNTTLTIQDSMGTAISTDATVEGNTLTIDASALNISDTVINGELIFQRQ